MNLHYYSFAYIKLSTNITLNSTNIIKHRFLVDEKTFVEVVI